MAPRNLDSIETVVKLLEAIRQLQLMVQRGLLHEINSHVSCEAMSRVKSQQDRESKDIDLSQAAGQAAVTSSVQNVMSSVKASFEKTVNVLDLFGNFLEAPSEETSEELKQLCDPEKSTGDELLTPEIDQTFDFLRSFLIDETKKSQDSSHESFSSEKHSREASAKYLKLNFEKRLELNSNKEQQQEKQQFAITHNNHHDKSVQVMHFSPGLSQVKQDCRNKHESKNFKKQEGAMKPIEDEIYIHSEIFNSVPTAIENGVRRDLDNEKSKKVKTKMRAKNFNIPDEDIDTAQLRDIEILNTTVNALKNKVHSLKVENQELLAELGQVLFEKAAKEREERKSELFQQIYRPSLTKAKQSVVSTSNDKAATEYDTLGYPNDNDSPLRESSYANENASTSNRCETCFSKAKASNENVDPTSPFSTAVSSKQAVQGAEFLVKEDDDQSEKEKIMTNDKDEGELHDGGQNGAGILTDNNENENPKTQTSSGEGINQSGSISRPSNAASTFGDENIEQSSTQQSYESLPFSVQQDYSNEKEKISLSNVPPTSVATTLYSNYKLLLLCLGQMLLSNDVIKLMTWATQNFPIVNPQNATHVLFQLDENEVINASDLSQLRHFFESIVRSDLVHVIDAFLLGDYDILRQITPLKKRDVTATQNPHTGTTTRYPNLFNAADTGQFSPRGSSLRANDSNKPHSSVLQLKQQPFTSLFSTHPTPYDAKFLPRFYNENQSTAYKAIVSNESRQVFYSAVTSKCLYCFCKT